MFSAPPVCRKLQALLSVSSSPDQPPSATAKSPRWTAAIAVPNSIALTCTAKPASAAIDWMTSPVCTFCGVL